jgi:hypothetical protein
MAILLEETSAHGEPGESKTEAAEDLLSYLRRVITEGSSPAMPELFLG